MRLLSFLVAAALLAGCALLPGAARPTASPGPGATLTAAAAATPAASPSPAAGATVKPRPGTPTTPVGLRVWLPPEFTPDVNTRGGQLLAEQIQAFETAHPGAAVEIRTKAASGTGGLLNSLMTAANAAPSVLPEVIALTRDDLAAATAAGLLAPLEAILPNDTLADYYPYAQAMARVGGVWVGLPFAADARVLAYLSTSYANPPLRWTDVLTGPFALPVAESTGLTVLDSYMAAGGTLIDANGKLHIDPEALSTTLEAYQHLQTAGLVLPSTLDYADAGTTWQAFRERRAALAVTNAEHFLAEYFRVSGASAALLPTAGEPPVALADGWAWAIVNTAPERRGLAAELIRWLAAPEQNGPWTEAAGVLPTRAGSLAAWKSSGPASVAAGVVAHAQLQPVASVLAAVGPALQEALAAVLNGRATPFAAAAVAAAAVNQP
jgi:ABC-type glycerol-3-phosphate transport system substrate-binding protein